MARIMLVDDDESILKVLSKFLSGIGHEVVGTANSGQDALDMARCLMPDLALMDIVMPGEVDGIKAAGIMKGEMKIPSIFVTGYTDDEYRARAKFVEPYGYIVKPFRLSEVQAMIEMALYKENADRRLREQEQPLGEGME